MVHVAKTNVSGNVEPTTIGNRVTIGKLAHAQALLMLPCSFLFSTYVVLVLIGLKVVLLLILVCTAIYVLGGIDSL